MTICLILRLGIGVEAYWIAVPALCLWPALLVVARFPAVLIPLLIFTSTLKAQPAASNMDLHDPTFWALALLLATVLLHTLLSIAGVSRMGHVPKIEGLGVLTYLFFAWVISFSYLYTAAPDFGFQERTHFLVIGSVLYFAPFILVRSEKGPSPFDHQRITTLVAGRRSPVC